MLSNPSVDVGKLDGFLSTQVLLQPLPQGVAYLELGRTPPKMLTDGFYCGLKQQKGLLPEFHLPHNSTKLQLLVAAHF